MSKWTYKLTRSSNGYIVDTSYGNQFVCTDSVGGGAEEINQLAGLVEALKFIVGEEIPMTVPLCESAGINTQNHHCSEYEFDVGVDIVEPDDEDETDEDDPYGSVDEDTTVFGDEEETDEELLNRCLSELDEDRDENTDLSLEGAVPCKTCGGRPNLIFNKYDQPGVMCTTCGMVYFSNNRGLSITMWNSKQDAYDAPGTPFADKCVHCYTAGGNGLAIGACRKYSLVDMNCEEECPTINLEGAENEDFDDLFEKVGRT
mgnify:CR=1 FL=1